MGWNQVGSSPFTEFSCKTTKTCNQNDVITKKGSSSGWLWYILENVFYLLLLILTGLATQYYAGEHMFPKVNKRLPVDTRSRVEREIERVRRGGNETGNQTTANAPNTDETSNGRERRSSSYSAISRMNSGGSLPGTPAAEPDDTDSAAADPRWSLLTTRRNMRKKGQAEKVFKDRTVWVEINDSLATANLTLSKEGQKGIFAKKPKKIPIKSVYDIKRMDPFTASISYKTPGVFSALVTIFLRIPDDSAAATLWFDTFESIHSAVDDAEQASRTSSTTGYSK